MKKLYALFVTIILTLSLFSLNAQIPNNGFENWMADGNDYNPVDWSTTNNSPYISVTPYTPAYAGNFSMKVSTYFAEILTVTGVAAIEFPYSERPSEINACIKTTIMPGDKVTLYFSLYKGDSIIASPTYCSFSIDTTISDFTCLSFPITYQSNLIPDTANITIIAGSASAQLGTEIIVDELSFNLSSSTDETISVIDKPVVNYPNPSGNFTYIPVNMLTGSNVLVLIWDIEGNLVQSQSFQELTSGKHELFINTSQHKNGIYPYTVKGKGFIYNGKIVICR